MLLHLNYLGFSKYVFTVVFGGFDPKKFQITNTNFCVSWNSDRKWENYMLVLIVYIFSVSDLQPFVHWVWDLRSFHVSAPHLRLLGIFIAHLLYHLNHVWPIVTHNSFVSVHVRALATSLLASWLVTRTEVDDVTSPASSAVQQWDQSFSCIEPFMHIRACFNDLSEKPTLISKFQSISPTLLSNLPVTL